MEKEMMVKTAHPDYSAEIVQLMQSNLTPKPLRERLLDYHEKDIAESLAVLAPEKRRKLYRVLDLDTLADVLEYAEERAPYLDELELRRRAEILSRLEPQTATAYLEELTQDDKDTIMSLMTSEVKEELTLLASFDKEEIGSRMSTDYISIRESLDIRSAMSALVSQAADNDNVSTLYVVDESDTLIGAIELTDLIRARATTPLEDIIMTSYPYVYATEPVTDALERIRGYSEDSIPVLNTENKLCGVLTAKDVSMAVEEELGEDYAMLGGLRAEEDLREPLRRSIGKRLPWLIVLFGLGLLVSSVVGFFDSVVAKLSIIVSFQSLILGMAGNVGTQSLAVTIRTLSDETVKKKQKLFLIFKEARVGLCNGLLLGLLSFVLIGLYLFLLRGEAPTVAFAVSLCTGAALAVSMLLSGISGTAIPLVLEKLGVDPAVASGPFITTVNDLVAVLTYYGLASLFLLPLAG